MSEPEPRPSWMPSDEEFWDSVAPMVDFDHGDMRAMEGVKLLIERAVLKAQIEALELWYDSDGAADVLDAELAHLRARLAELE